MEKAFSVQKFICLILCCILISSCSSVKITGQYVDEKELNKITTYKMSKNEVASLLGLPNYIPNYNQDSWYYIQTFTTTKTLSLPKLTKQRIAKITFDEYGIVDDAIILPNQPNDNFSIDRDRTGQIIPNQAWFGKMKQNAFRFKPV